MLFRYRFKGKVNSQFVVRGMLFKVGSNIDFCFTEKELEFAKKHCTTIEIVDREPPKVLQPPKSVLKATETEIENKSKGVESELQPKRNGNANKGKHKANI